MHPNLDVSSELHKNGVGSFPPQQYGRQTWAESQLQQRNPVLFILKYFGVTLDRKFTTTTDVRRSQLITDGMCVVGEQYETSCFHPDISTNLLGKALTRTAWVRLIRVRTGVRRFRSCLPGLRIQLRFHLRLSIFSDSNFAKFPTSTFKNIRIRLLTSIPQHQVNEIWLLKSMEIVVHSAKFLFQQKFQNKLCHFNRNSQFKSVM